MCMVVLRGRGALNEATLVDGRIGGKHRLLEAVGRRQRYALPRYIRRRHNLEDRKQVLGMDREQMFERLTAAFVNEYFSSRDIVGVEYKLFGIYPDPREKIPAAEGICYEPRDIFTRIPKQRWATSENYRRLLAVYPATLAYEGRRCTDFLVDALRLLPSNESDFYRAFKEDLPHFLALTETTLTRIADIAENCDQFQAEMRRLGVLFKQLAPSHH